MKKILLICMLLCMFLPSCVMAELSLTGIDESKGNGVYTVTGNSVTISGTGTPVLLEGNGSLTLTLDGARITESAIHENGQTLIKDAGIELEGFEQVTIRIKGRNNYVGGENAYAGIEADCPLYFEDAGDGRLTVNGHVNGICADNMTVRSGALTINGYAENGGYGVNAESLMIQGGNLSVSCGEGNGKAVAGRIEYTDNVIVEKRNALGVSRVELHTSGDVCSSRMVKAYTVGSVWDIKMTASSGELKSDENGFFRLPGGSYTLSGSANRPVMIEGSGKLYLTLDNVNVDLGNRHDPALPAALRIDGYDEVIVKFVGRNDISGDVGMSISCKTTVKGEPGAKLIVNSTNEESFYVVGDLILDGGEIEAHGFCDIFAVKGENSNITVKKGVIHAIATNEDSNAFYIEGNSNGKITIEDGKIDVDATGMGLGSLYGGTILIKGGALFVKGDQWNAVINQIQYADGVVVEGRNSDSEDWQPIASGDRYNGKQVRAKGPTSFTDVVEDESELNDKQIGKPTLQMNKGQNPDAREIDVRVEEREYPEDTDTGYMKWYEVELLDENGDPVEIKGKAKLWIPYPAGYGPDDTQMEYEIRHIKSNGEEEIFSTKDGSIQRKPYGLQIEIDEFSPFELDWGEKEGGAQAGSLPHTGDESNLALWCALMVVFGAAVLMRRRRYS